MTDASFLIVYSRQRGLHVACKTTFDAHKTENNWEMKVCACAREELDKKAYDSNRIEMLWNASLTGSMGLYQS